MNLKKALSLIAFGFLFTLVSINLTVNGQKINLTPDFIGWILMMVAFDNLGDYVKDKMYLKWMSLILAVAYAVLWIFSLVKPELNLGILNTCAAIVSSVYMFMLFGILEKIAHDIGSARESTIRMLKILNLGSYLAVLVCGLVFTKTEAPVFGVLVLVFGVAIIVCAVITAVVLFKLKKEMDSIA